MCLCVRTRGEGSARRRHRCCADLNGSDAGSEPPICDTYFEDQARLVAVELCCVCVCVCVCKQDSFYRRSPEWVLALVLQLLLLALLLRL